MSRVINLCCVLGIAAPVAFMQAPSASADTGCPTPAPFVDGNGQSAGSAYEIASPANLQYLRENPAIWDDNLFFSLHADIDMTGCTWTGGIGEVSGNANGFTGSIDGNAHVISGMNIVSTAATRVGLIAYQAAGNIEDLGVQGTITINALASGSANNEVGGLVGGSSSTGTIQRSFADVDIVVNASSTESCNNMFTPPMCSSSVSVYAGGLLGYSNSITVSDAYARGDVSVTSSATGSSGYSTLFVGGLIGALYYKTVTNSYSTGAPTAVATLGSSNIRLGGFSGFAGGNAGVFMEAPGSVWDTTTSNTSTGLGLNQGSTVLPTGKTTAEMKSISTYPAWNISSTYDATKTWIVCPTINNGYPAFMLSQPVGACSPPDVSAVTPASGTTAGGTTVTISGTNLANATSVTIDGTAATVTANTATSITATTPAGTAGAADIVVTTGNGSDTLVGGFTYAAPQSNGNSGQSNSTSAGQPSLTSTPATSPATSSSEQSLYPEIIPTPPVSVPAPSSATAVVDGIPTGSTVTQSGTTTTVTTPGTGTTFAVTAPSNPGTLPAGSPVRFTFTGGRPGTPVSIYVMSDPVLVANAVTDAAGDVSGFVTLPASIVPGQHTLVVSGYAGTGAAVSSYLGIEVSVPARTRRAHVLFDLGSYRLSPSARKTLDALVVRARGTAPATVTVGAVRASGATADDRRLALRRARVVAAYLRDEGMPGTVRVGASLPTRMTTAQARRVDVTVTFR